MTKIVSNERIMVTGGCGFIGSALMRHLIKRTQCHVLNIDKLTYAANSQALEGVNKSERYQFAKADICDRLMMNKLISEFRPDTIFHLAAESHVDRSISAPAVFMQTNIMGTYSILEESLGYWNKLSSGLKSSFRFIHISTDEVFGDLENDAAAFNETTPYAPSSPYSASKASSDHLVRAWNRTYGLPVIITNCSNNYGPYQHQEKLIPHMATRALLEKPLPIYGDGKNIRDWLYVDDHIDALMCVLNKGVIGETYCIGGNNEQSNIDLVRTLCNELDKLKPRHRGRYFDLIEFVQDRAGHDKRYAIDNRKITSQLGWRPLHNFQQGLNKTLQWLLSSYPQPTTNPCNANKTTTTSGEAQ